MAMFKKDLDKVLSGVGESLEKYGFSYDAEASEEQGETAKSVYSGEKGALLFEYDGKILAVYQGETSDTATKKISASLLEDMSNDKDVRYVTNEINETLESKFSQKKGAQKKGSVQKTVQTVSKNAVRNGSSYDANTLASKLCLVFPELRPYYKENLARYGEFLGEEFFTRYGTKPIIDAIKENDPQTMKRLFQILNEIYEDGTLDTQSLIAVTILGELGNDQILLARCVDYMSETMAPPVIEVNKFLVTSAGKRAKKQLENPPVYKPKKKKKPGMFAQAMAQSGGTMPPV